MTYGDLKREIKTLGFEENSTMTEYNDIVIDCCNRAIQHVYDDSVMILKWYFEKTLTRIIDGEEVAWYPIRPILITSSTSDDFVIDIPDELISLVPLLASYFVWLDDDSTKATYYWNTYDEFRETLVKSYTNQLKARIGGGISWVR